MSMPLPSGRLSSLTLRNELSALQSSSLVELALLPSPYRVTYEHAAPFWASKFPLILKNEFSALQSSPSVELALLPSLRGSPMSMPLPSERLEFPLILRNEFSTLQSSVISHSPCWSS